MQFNKLYIFIFLGLIILNLAFFAFNLNNFFLSDDFDWLNLTKNSQHSLFDYFGANYYGERGVGGSYRPMVNLAFWLNYKIGGLNPLPYHLTNLIFHLGVCFLIYFLVLILFEEFIEKKRIAILAALFFSILPNHSEAVIWVSAVADPVAAFFYLLAFYFYILFRKKEKFSFLLISIVAFVLSLLTKEIAITLPLLILVWELFQYIMGKQGSNALLGNSAKVQGHWLSSFKKIILYPLGYWLFLILYFLIRFASIGLIFGYYARETFKIDLGAIFKMFVSLITDLFFYGGMRVFLTNYFFTNKLFFVFLLILILTLIWLALRNYKFKVPFLFDAYFILILPVLLLNFNNFTDEGERYNYLPSVVFCILLSSVVIRFLDRRKNQPPSLDGSTKLTMTARALFLAGLLIYFGFFLINKNYNWQQASKIAERIIFTDFPKAVDLNKNNDKLLFVGLPDNFAGAPIFRNGIKLAINLYYPNYKLNGELLNVYLRLLRQNWDQQILKWADYPTGGYLAKTIDGRYWVTGFDRRETADYIFELWNYNYSNFTSDTIRLILKNDQGEFLKAGEEKEKIIIFDQGQLKSLNK